jgi:PTH1 family peptidyl-tRNA hydrolase
VDDFGRPRGDAKRAVIGCACEIAMKLIVGLGNIGTPYVFTPHNLGFMAVELIGERARIDIKSPGSKSLAGLGTLSGHEVVLAKPQTMMNLSGYAVRDLLKQWECEPRDLILLYDDVALPWGMLRVRENGTAGGHNGVKSVIGAIGTMDFARVRMGVQPEHPIGDLAEYVLHPMRNSERETVAEVAEQAADAVEAILTVGMAQAMNRFNRRVAPPGETEE